MEILPIRLKTSNSTWFELYNVFQPNTPTQNNSLDLSLIKLGPSSLILSNLNDHAQMLDLFQTSSFCGDEILDINLDNDLHILKDSSVTGSSRITEIDSIPNISLFVSNWSVKTFLKPAEPIGCPNHLRIVIVTSLSSRKLLDGDVMALTGHV